MEGFYNPWKDFHYQLPECIFRVSSHSNAWKLNVIALLHCQQDESCAAKLFIVALGFCFWEINQMKCDDNEVGMGMRVCASGWWGCTGFDQIKRQPVCLAHPLRDTRIPMQRHWHCNLKTSSWNAVRVACLSRSVHVWMCVCVGGAALYFVYVCVCEASLSSSAQPKHTRLRAKNFN